MLDKVKGVVPQSCVSLPGQLISNTTFQAGIDRYNLSSVDRTHLIVEWQLKHLPFSIINAEIGVSGKVNRAMIMQRYASKIEKMFSEDVTVRKTSRELTYIEEEEEEKVPEITVTTTVNKPTAVKEENITIVNVENETEEREEVSKEGHDRHVRFMEEIDFKETDQVNEKTS